MQFSKCNSKWKITFFIVLAVAIFWQCNHGKHTVKLTEEDKVELTIYRFGQDFYALKQDTLTIANLTALKNKYPDFFSPYIKRIANIASNISKQTLIYFEDFLYDVPLTNLYKETQDTFADFSQYVKQLEKAFSYYHHYFPKRTIPKIITFFYGFNYAIVALDSSLCIALDQFLGQSHFAYKNRPIYIRHKKRPEFLVSEAMRGWITSEFVPKKSPENLLDAMLQKGKILYCLQQTLPWLSERHIMGYTEKEMKFCKNNEYHIWAFYVEKKLLYESGAIEISKYAQPAPFSPGMPEGAPGRTAVYSGLQIIKAYMQETGATLEELMENFDFSEILRQSNYRPERP